MSEETVSLLGRLLSRRPDDLDAARRLARGEEVPEESLRKLQRAGFLRRRLDGRPGLLPTLVAPLLALEESIAEGGRRLLGVLQRRLRRSETKAERESVLEAMFEELSGHRRRLSEMGVSGSEEELLPVLRELRSTLEALDQEAADPGLVMGTATLAAELIEMIGRGLAPRRRRTPAREEAVPLRRVTTAQLAGLIGSVPRMARPLMIPDPIELAAALQGERLPERVDPTSRSLPVAVDRRREVGAALATHDPMSALYAEVGAEPAFERHAALAVLGRKGLDEASLIPVASTRRIGEVEVGELSEVVDAEIVPADIRVVA